MFWQEMMRRKLARIVAARAVGNQDPGVIALAAWAAAEVAGSSPTACSMS